MKKAALARGLQENPNVNVNSKLSAPSPGTLHVSKYSSSVNINDTIDSW